MEVGVKLLNGLPGTSDFPTYFRARGSFNVPRKLVSARQFLLARRRETANHAFEELAQNGARRRETVPDWYNGARRTLCASKNSANYCVAIVSLCVRLGD
jgi:hypothetical protein